MSIEEPFRGAICKVSGLSGAEKFYARRLTTDNCARITTCLSDCTCARFGHTGVTEPTAGQILESN